MAETIEFRKAGVGVMLILQVIFIVLFAFFVDYTPMAKPSFPPSVGNETAANESEVRDYKDLTEDYPIFQDISVMIFIGFGFLMALLRRYAHGGLLFTFLLAAVSVQWAILVHGFFHWDSDHKFDIDIHAMVYGEEASAAVLITLGIVLGKVTPVGLVFMSLLEISAYVMNEYLCAELLKAMDNGGSMYLHGFGAYFGMTMSAVIALNTATIEENKLEAASYVGDLASMIGSLFLWVFWPSFLGIGSKGEIRYRIIINTYLALLSSCVTGIAASSAFNKEFKFEMVQVQNATLAGGVAIGATANAMIQPYGALIIGFVAGLISSAGFAYVQNFLRTKCHIHDTCGAHNLHGMPGILGGISGIVMAMFATREVYGAELAEVYPAVANSGRSPSEQALFQTASVVVTLGFAITAGLIAGAFLRYVFPSYGDASNYYKDEEWITEEEES